jgi:hypothetical protein
MAESFTGIVIAVATAAGGPLGLPQTRITLEDGVRVAEVVVPGSNAVAPGAVAIGTVPQVAVGETWRMHLVETRAGLSPRGLGDGMARISPPQPPYNLNGLHYPDSALPRAFYLNEVASEQIGVEVTEAIAIESLRQWSIVDCSTFGFTYAGRTNVGFSEDGVNVLSWQESDWPYSEDIAGLTATRFGTDDEGNVIPVEADILFNGESFDWFAGAGDVVKRELDAGSVLTHELGHVTGMDHEYYWLTSTMYFGYVGGTWMGTLSGDDRRGLCENYPSGLPDCTSDEDCRDQDASDRTCVAIGGLDVCDEVRSATGDFCSRTDFNCTDYCVTTTALLLEGYCSVPCADACDCPSGWSCGTPKHGYPTAAADGSEVRACLQPSDEDTGDACDSGEADSAPPDTGDSGGDTGDGGGGGGGAAAGEQDPVACACGQAPVNPAGIVPAALIGGVLWWRRRRPWSSFLPRSRLLEPRSW